MERRTDGQTKWRKERKTDRKRKTDRQTEKQKGRWTDDQKGLRAEGLKG